VFDSESEEDTSSARSATSPCSVELAILIMEEVLSYISRRITVEHVCITNLHSGSTIATICMKSNFSCMWLFEIKRVFLWF